jgi:outer membrane protein assembly factor BamA
MKNKIYVIIITLFTSVQVFAQKDSTAQKRLSITPLPLIVKDPFMGWGYGALANVNFMIGDANTTRFSNAQVYAMGTTKGQFAAQANHTIFTNNEEWMIQGKFQYLDWNENVYGLGARTDSNMSENIKYKAIEFEQSFLKKVGKKNFIGLQYRLYNCWDIVPDNNIRFFKSDNNVIGKESFVSSSIGLRFIHDSRDNVQNAYKGNYAEVTVNPNFTFLGSTQQWTNIRVDLRNYVMLNKNINHPQVLAARVMYEQAIGDVPYMIMPMFGRYFTTRGYVQGRFRGKTFISTEAEYRAHIWKIFGGVLFAGLHSVSEPNGSIQNINPTAGGGVRIMLTKSQRVNLRIDYALGLINNEGGLYFQITEAF